jgi:hypothetical protein
MATLPSFRRVPNYRSPVKPLNTTTSNLNLAQPGLGGYRESADVKFLVIPSRQDASDQVSHSAVVRRSCADAVQERSLIRNSFTQFTVFPLTCRRCHWPCFAGSNRRRFFGCSSWSVNLATGLPSRVMTISDSTFNASENAVTHSESLKNEKGHK